MNNESADRKDRDRGACYDNGAYRQTEQQAMELQDNVGAPHRGQVPLEDAQQQHEHVGNGLQRVVVVDDHRVPEPGAAPGPRDAAEDGDDSLPRKDDRLASPALLCLVARRWSSAHEWLKGRLSRHRAALHRLVVAAGHLLVAVYVAFAVTHWYGQQHQQGEQAATAEGTDGGGGGGEGKGGGGQLKFCEGLGFLLLILGVVYLGVLYYAVLKPFCFPWLARACGPLRKKASPCVSRRAFRWTVLAAVLAALLALLLVDIGKDTRRLVSLLGVVVFVVLGLVFSRHTRQVRWRPVLTGLFLQFLMGLLTIRFPAGRHALECLAEKVAAMLYCANKGSLFVFGEMLVIEKGVFAFQVLPVVFFFSSLIQVLYFLGAMQWVVSRVGGLLQAIMGTTVCESVNAAGSVFLGMTESPLLIKPFIEHLTLSELHAVMGTGFATASGSVLAAYISFGADPGHLLTASIMSATGALAYSKLLLPETEESKTTVEQLGDSSSVEVEDSSVIDAAAKGASAAISIVLNIAANLVAFVSLLHLVNSVVAWLGALVGLEDFSFEMILSKVFIPVVWLMGVEPADCERVATLVGLKTVINEFVAFQRMGEMKAANELSPRSLALSTLVLCGFANLASLAILMSVLSAIAPAASTKVSNVAMRSLVSGIVTCCITASMGGMLMTEDSFSAA